MISAIKLLFIIGKNLKVLFRSWTSLLLLIIGPLLLIAIVGFAFGGETLNDIRMGVYSPDRSQIEDIVGELEDDSVSIYYYDNIDDCIYDIKRESVHICAEFSKDFLVSKGGDEIEFSTGDITFYYDNSKLNLVTAVVGFVKEKVAITSEQITLESTKTILSNIEDSVVFMVEAQLQIENFTVQAEDSKLELIEFRDTLVEIKQNFDPPYIRVKNVQQDFNAQVDAIAAKRVQLNADTDALYIMLDSIYNETLRVEKVSIDTFPEFNLSINENITNTSLNISQNLTIPTGLNFSAVRSQIDIVKFRLSGITSDLDSAYSDIDALRNDMNLLVESLDQVNETLAKDIDKLNKNIEDLDKAIVQLQRLSSILSEKIGKFSGLSQEQADALLKPIRSFFNSLLGEQSKIYLIFPVLLAFIIMFISILLSNMMVLDETHSSAYFRNFLLPVPNLCFAVGLFVTSMIVVFFQVGIFLWVAQSRFGIDVASNLWPIFGVVLMLIAVFSLIGMVLGYMIRSEQTSILVSTFVALAVFLFSDVIFPIESMPSIAGYIARFNPLVIGESMFRKILFYDIPYSAMTRQITVFLITIAVLLLFMLLLSKRRKD